MTDLARPETEAKTDPAERQRKPVDRNARLAIEAGPGSGYHNALLDMANADLGEAGARGGNNAPNRDPAGGIFAVERVGIDDLAFAVRQMEIRRLVLLTPFSDLASRQTVLALGRELSADRRTVALLELDGAGPASQQEPGAGAGWLDLLGGTRTVAEIIERDPMSRLHVAASGNVDLAALEQSQIEDLKVYLDAFSKAYALSILHCPVNAVHVVDPLDDADTAVIIVAAEDQTDAVREIARTLDARATYDLLHLVATKEASGLH